jgi:hypothetical protein
MILALSGAGGMLGTTDEAFNPIAGMDIMLGCDQGCLLRTSRHSPATSTTGANSTGADTLSLAQTHPSVAASAALPGSDSSCATGSAERKNYYQWIATDMNFSPHAGVPPVKIGPVADS